jgi:predicted ATPase
LILIVEDAHWIDPTTKELLDLLLPVVSRKPSLVVITYRPEYRQQWSGLPNARTLPVVRLSRADVVLMVDKMLAGKALAQEVLEQIIKKTDGVPLFVEELTKTIIESGQLIETEHSYIPDGSVAELVIPATIRDSLMARLDSAASMRQHAILPRTRDRSKMKPAPSGDLATPIFWPDESLMPTKNLTTASGSHERMNCS